MNSVSIKKKIYLHFKKALVMILLLQRFAIKIKRFPENISSMQNNFSLYA